MLHQGNILKKLIKTNGFKQQQFADLMGISRNYLIVILKETKIKNDYLKKAAEILNVNNSVFTESSNPEEDVAGVGAPSIDIYERLIKAMQEQIDLLKEDSLIIKKDVEVFRDIVKQGMDQGAIKFLKPSSK